MTNEPEKQVTVAPRWTQKRYRMALRHNLQSFQDNCAFCGEQVILSPSTKNAIEKNTEMQIVCLECLEKSGNKTTEFYLHPGGAEELVQAVINKNSSLN